MLMHSACIVQVGRPWQLPSLCWRIVPIKLYLILISTVILTFTAMIVSHLNIPLHLPSADEPLASSNSEPSSGWSPSVLVSLRLMLVVRFWEYLIACSVLVG